MQSAIMMVRFVMDLSKIVFLRRFFKGFIFMVGFLGVRNFVQ